MNKVGILSGCILIPFLLTLFFPWGKSLLGLYLFNDNGRYIGVFGSILGSTHNMALASWISTWWFTLQIMDPNQILFGVVLYAFPLISCVLCFVGGKKRLKKARSSTLPHFFSCWFPSCFCLSMDCF